ncbi:MAG: DUF11 domain-containing protein, partial [Acidobacteria bacterium]|nr:DUF11 domain-containing protein [Acidobacteriota bacterium]
TYSIVVTNNGPADVTGALVNDPLPAGITTANWSCAAGPGASCSPASGSGALNNVSVTLPLSASVTFSFTITVPAAFTGNLTNTATVTVPAGTTETNPNNNSATDTDTECLPNAIYGTVYGDGNDNGLMEATEAGFPYVVVKAYDASGNLVAQATSSERGSYALTGLVAGQPYRLEFEPPPGFFDGAAGSANGTSVQFVNAGTKSVKYGLHLPGQCLPQMNPRIVGGCAPATGSPFSVVSWRYNTRDVVNTANITGHSDDRTFSQVGIPQAFAADNTRQLAYFSTVSAPFAAFFPVAPDGRDSIYVADYSGAGFSFVSHKRLVRLTTDLGVNVTNQFPVGGGDKIGEYGLGGLDISDDLKTMWVVNQGKGNIAKLDISGVTYASLPATAPTSVTEIAIPTGVSNCVSGRFRPSALKFYNGQLYVGGVCDGATGTNANFAVKILAMDPATNTFTQKFSFNPTAFQAGTFGNSSVPQTNWKTTVSDFQPYLQDFGFDDTGSMIIGIMPRQIYSNGATPFGYWVRTWRNADGTFTLENNGVSGPFTSTAVDFPSIGGPGGSWFLDQGADPWHGASYNGGVFVLPGTGEVVGGFTDPWYCCSGGAKYASWRTGAVTASHVLAQAKVFTMTSVDQLCEPGPMEIGNRIWVDTDNNGIQDADEKGIPGVTVKLFKSGNLLATAVTDAQGIYIFTKGTETNPADWRGLVTGGLLENMDYEIRLNKLQAALAGFALSPANTDATTGGDLRDSDATMANDDAVIPYTTGTIIAGKNDHSLDVGFTPVPLSLGNRVWKDLNNNGVIDAADGVAPGVNGVIVKLLKSDLTPALDLAGTAVPNQTTANGGYYRFDNLPAGDYVVEIVAGNFTGTGVLVGCVSSRTTELNPNDDKDSN